MQPPDPIAILTTAVDSYEPYLQPSGEIFDPIFREPTQYGTPYHALCQAVLARDGDPAQRDERMEKASRGLDASLLHLHRDPQEYQNASGMDRVTGAIGRINHRDFFWPPVLKCYRILAELGAPQADDFALRIADVGILHAFRSRPPSNWAMVWVSGEWLRMEEGLSLVSQRQFDTWLEVFFANRTRVEQGFYQEPGHPNSYDLFTRYHLADILLNGYDGAWQTELAQLMETGLRRSLDVQLSDGSLASAYRSTGQTWTLGAQCAYFTHAANFFSDRDPQLSQLAADGAQRALTSFARWQRLDGPYSPVENLLPPAYRVGYESYTADGHYANLALGFLAVAIDNGLRLNQRERHVEQDARTRIEDDPTWRAVLHRGPYSAHVNAFPSPNYDGFGLVDVTFGPGRRFHFVSSVRHLSEPGFFNLGMALREGPGRSPLRVIAQEDSRLVGELSRGDTDASLRLHARAKGSPYLYELALDIDDLGVHVEERTPNLVGHKTLLVPYLRDGGWTEKTQVNWRVDADETVIDFRLAGEHVQLLLGARVEHILDFPYGYENRRGLCGLLRVDLAEETDWIRYRLTVIA